MVHQVEPLWQPLPWPLQLASQIQTQPTKEEITENVMSFENRKQRSFIPFCLHFSHSAEEFTFLATLLMSIPSYLALVGVVTTFCSNLTGKWLSVSSMTSLLKRLAKNTKSPKGISNSHIRRSEHVTTNRFRFELVGSFELYLCFVCWCVMLSGVRFVP